jgi:choline kinase
MRPQRAIVLAGHAATSQIGSQLEALAQCDIFDVTLVAPIEPHTDRTFLGHKVRFVQNPFPRHTGGVFSLWLVRGVFRLGALIVQADARVDPDALQRLVNAPVPDAVLVNPDAGSQPMILVKVGAEGGRHLVRHVEALLAEGGSHASVSDALRSLSRQWPLRPVMSVDVSLMEFEVTVAVRA